MLAKGRAFWSCWLMQAPSSVGLVVALGVLLWVFFAELIHELAHMTGMTPEAASDGAVADRPVLAGQPHLIVIFSGYENPVSRIDTGDDEDRPEWMATVNFSTCRSAIASIVAISAICCCCAPS